MDVLFSLKVVYAIAIPLLAFLGGLKIGAFFYWVDDLFEKIVAELQEVSGWLHSIKFDRLGHLVDCLIRYDWDGFAKAVVDLYRELKDPAKRWAITVEMFSDLWDYVSAKSEGKALIRTKQEAMNKAA